MNSEGFNHFKLYSDNTLKSMNKDELISYIHMLHHNWRVADERFCNVIEVNKKLDKALKKACYELSVLDNNLLDDIGWEEWCWKNVE